MAKKEKRNLDDMEMQLLGSMYKVIRLDRVRNGVVDADLREDMND